jgi:hypothetical protein
MTSSERRNRIALWMGIAAGAAIGIGFSLARNRRRSRAHAARRMGRRVADASAKLVAVEGRKLAREGRKLMDEAAGLWSHGRKLAVK